MGGNGVGERLSRFVRSFSGQQLAIIGVLGVLTLVAGLAFFNWISAPTSRVLATGLTPDEANDMVETLNGAGIGYELTDGGATIVVPEASVEEANLALAESGVGTSSVVGYEIFDSQSFTTSDFQQQIGYQRAIQGELTRAIMAMDGIDYASVQLGMPTDRLFTEDQEAVTAGILVEGDRIQEGTVQAIVQLASSSVPGLQPEDVTVTDTQGNVLTGPGASTGGQSTQLEMTQAYETMLAARVESMLAQVYGPGAAVVSVTADLSFDESETEITDYQGDPVIIRESTTDETFTGTAEDAQGITGVEGAELPTGGDTTDYSSTEAIREQVVDSVVTRERLAPGRVERLSVAVMVDENPILGYEELPADAAEDAEPEPIEAPAPDADEIAAVVTAGLGLQVDPADPASDQLNVLLVDFPDITPEDAASATEAAETAASQEGGSNPLFGYVRMAFGAIVLLLALLFLRKGLTTKSEPIDPEAVAGALPSGGPRPVAELRRQDADALGVPSELRLIDQDPEQVATLLREWVADRRV
jgi:flagellar M-ring protein FliF